MKGPHPFPFILPGLIALLLALLTGLARLPWSLPDAGLGMLHGPLMICGFLGTVIGAERAKAIARPWAWLAPLCTGLGALVLLLAAQIQFLEPIRVQQAGASLFVLGSLGLVAIFSAIVRRQPALFNWVMAAGAVCFAAGNLVLLLGRPIFEAVPLWSAFLVLTISGERLELNRLMAPRAGARAWFLIAAAVQLAGAVLALFHLTGSAWLSGTGMLLLASWLITNDIARRTVRMEGVTRYVAVCLLSGYAWLAASGLLAILDPIPVAGLGYDARLHTLFIGFVLTMIFGHAPIVLPALLGAQVDFRNRLYAPLILLHLSLALRVVGDLAAWLPGRRWGGLINVVVLLLFLVMLIRAVKRARHGVTN